MSVMSELGQKLGAEQFGEVQKNNHPAIEDFIAARQEKNRKRQAQRKAAAARLRNANCLKALEIDQLKETVAIDTRERREVAKSSQKQGISLVLLTRKLAEEKAKVVHLEFENSQLKAQLSRFT